jgi:hypothetical protein
VKRKLRVMFLVTELNLILWLFIFGIAVRSIEEQDQASWWTATAEIKVSAVLVGVAFAAIVQHWAYYAVYKEASRREDGNINHQ